MLHRIFKYSITVGIAGMVLLLVGAVAFPPAGVVGVTAVLSAAVAIGAVHARETRRPALAVLAVSSLALWVTSAAITIGSWKQVFELGDAGRAVPAGLTEIMGFAFGVSVLMFLVASGTLIVVMRDTHHVFGEHLNGSAA